MTTSREQLRALLAAVERHAASTRELWGAMDSARQCIADEDATSAERLGDDVPRTGGTMIELMCDHCDYVWSPLCRTGELSVACPECGDDVFLHSGPIPFVEPGDVVAPTDARAAHLRTSVNEWAESVRATVAAALAKHRARSRQRFGVIPAVTGEPLEVSGDVPTHGAPAYTLDPAWLAALHERGPVRIRVARQRLFVGVSVVEYYQVGVVNSGELLASARHYIRSEAVSAVVAEVRRIWRSRWAREAQPRKRDDRTVEGDAMRRMVNGRTHAELAGGREFDVAPPRKRGWLTRLLSGEVLIWEHRPVKRSWWLNNHYSAASGDNDPVSTTPAECLARFGVVPEAGGEPIEVEL